jgi:hypothetical protein
MSFEMDPRRGPRRPVVMRPKRVGIGFGIWFAFCALLSLGTLGFGIWAVYELVTWVTSK